MNPDIKNYSSYYLFFFALIKYHDQKQLTKEDLYALMDPEETVHHAGRKWEQATEAESSHPQM